LQILNYLVDELFSPRTAPWFFTIFLLPHLLAFRKCHCFLEHCGATLEFSDFSKNFLEIYDWKFGFGEIQNCFNLEIILHAENYHSDQQHL